MILANNDLRCKFSSRLASTLGGSWLALGGRVRVRSLSWTQGLRCGSRSFVLVGRRRKGGCGGASSGGGRALLGRCGDRTGTVGRGLAVIGGEWRRARKADGRGGGAGWRPAGGPSKGLPGPAACKSNRKGRAIPYSEAGNSTLFTGLMPRDGGLGS